MENRGGDSLRISENVIQITVKLMGDQKSSHLNEMSEICSLGQDWNRASPDRAGE